MEPKPALLLTLDYPPQPGGVANYYWQLIQHLPVGRVRVVTNENNQLVSPWLNTWLVLRRQYRQQPFSKIIVGQILPLGTVVWLWHLIFGTPYIVWTHGMDITVPQRWWRKRWLMRRIVHSAQSIITVSNYSADRLRELIPHQEWSKIMVLPPGPNSTPQHPAESLPVTLPSKYILSVGRLVARKGFDTVMAALSQLPHQYSNVQYCIAGDGPARAELETQVRSLQLEQRVHFLGHVTDGQLVTLYQQCQYLVMPARRLPTGDFEGFGIVVLEANTFGKPAIGSLAGGMAEAIEHEQTGLLVPPDDVTQLANAMQRLLSDQVLCQRLGQQAQIQVVNRRQWAVNAQQLLALLEAR